MNAGKLVTIAFIAFAAFIGSLAVRAYHADNDLVSDEYYEDELLFDSQRQSEANYSELSTTVNISQQVPGLVVTFPKDLNPISGSINFYRAENKTLDRHYTLELNENKQQILPYDEFHSGSYELTLEWSEGEKTYRHKEIVMFE